jgi:hypothetical protein
VSAQNYQLWGFKEAVVSLGCVEHIASWLVVQAWPRDVVPVQVPHMMLMSHVIGDLQQQYWHVGAAALGDFGLSGATQVPSVISRVKT